MTTPKIFRACAAFALTAAVSAAPLLGAPREARTSVNSGGRNLNATRNTNANTNINRNTNVNRNVNVNRDVDVNVNVNRYGYGGCCYHPVAAAAAVIATAAVVGSMVAAASMPTTCVTEIVGGVAFQHCGSAWYQPQYVGTTVSYVVVTHP